MIALKDIDPLGIYECRIGLHRKSEVDGRRQILDKNLTNVCEPTLADEQRLAAVKVDPNSL